MNNFNLPAANDIDDAVTDVDNLKDSVERFNDLEFDAPDADDIQSAADALDSLIENVKRARRSRIFQFANECEDAYQKVQSLVDTVDELLEKIDNAKQQLKELNSLQDQL